MSFRRQVLVGHAALVAIVLLIATVALVAFRVTTSRLGTVAHDLSSDMIATHRLRYQAEQVVATSRGYLLTGNPATLTRFDEAVAHVNETLATLYRRAELQDDVARVDAAANDYIVAAKRAARERTASSDPRDVLPFFETTLAPARNRFEDALDSFANREQRTFDAAADRALGVADESQAIVSIGSVLVAALAGALAWLSIRKLNAQYTREREATAHAERATAARDELLAIVSHDLRSPLTAVTMATELLGETANEPGVRAHAGRIRNATSRMEHLIDQLLEVTRLERGKFELDRERCDVPGLLDATAALFEARAAEAGIDLHVEGDAAVVVVDRERVLQVLTNLVGNALKFTKRGGRIYVTARPDGAHVRFEVRDTGPGIAAEQVPHLFERYWQGRARPRGSLGLGLYICKQLVTAHGGDIGVQSTPGEGSTFWFTLPAG